MKKEIYICDYCKKILSDDKIAEKHLSINFNPHSGWVEKRNNWVHIHKVRRHIFEKFVFKMFLVGFKK